MKGNMIRKILSFPDPELKKKSQPVTIINDKTRELIQDMAETMYDAPGVGLAAPQIGVHQRIIIIDVSSREETPALIVAINPVIVHADGESFEEEGCLSVPKYAANHGRHLQHQLVPMLEVISYPGRAGLLGFVVIAGLEMKPSMISRENRAYIDLRVRHEISGGGSGKRPRVRRGFRGGIGRAGGGGLA